MRRQKQNLWTGGIALGCAAVALLIAPRLLRGYDSGQAAVPLLEGTKASTVEASEGAIGAVNPAPLPAAIVDSPRFIMNPFSNPRNPQEAMLKDWLDVHQRMAPPASRFSGNSSLKVDLSVKGC